MGLIKDKFTAFNKRLLRVHDEEPLGKLSLVIIIALDIFILFIIFGGLDRHTKQLTSPSEYIPWEARAAFIEGNWTEANKIAKLQNLVLRDYHRYSRNSKKYFKDSDPDVMHPRAKEFFLKIKAMAENEKLKILFVSRQSLVKEKNSQESQFQKNKSVYSTSLLEEAANVEGGVGAVASVASAAQQGARKINKLKGDITNFNTKINDHSLVKDLWGVLKIGNSAHRAQLVKDLNRFEFKYKFKELAWQLLFLLPIFFVFYFWNSQSIRKENEIRTLISSHLVVIAAFPILIKLIEIVMDYIPMHFFKGLFKVFVALNIVGLWYYLVIFGSIVVALLCIYVIQKKIFNKARLERTRLMKGQCCSCGKKCPEGISACPFCGESQFKTCGSCNEKTYRGGEFCVHCGSASDF